MTIPKRILPTIVFAQFAGTSLWFAGNAILPQIQVAWGLPDNALANVTSAVMLGFILGTFLFAFFSIADRFKPSMVFLICSVLGAVSNISVVLFSENYALLIATRFATGFFLAGIYPVGMKIASDWFAGNLGKALGYLVGALVLGTAFPHLLTYLGADYPWTAVMVGTSILAILGGALMIWLVGEGPYRVKGARFEPAKLVGIFKDKDFRNAAFGYFGHMWELYTFWAFVPIIITSYSTYSGETINTSLWSFITIAVGTIGCIAAGKWSLKKGSAKIALLFLLLSGIACVISPFFFESSVGVFLAFMAFWGIVVIADSAQFSALNAQTCPKELKGTALTIAVSIGFFLTIPSIQLMSYLNTILPAQWLLMTLVIGPIFGLAFARNLLIR